MTSHGISVVQATSSNPLPLEPLSQFAPAPMSTSACMSIRVYRIARDLNERFCD
eukprot:m.76407 g.76407  ORF g.76407 m.76407 type:complete len:54 (+) comp24894_c0_seq1:156-317(+)